MEHAAVVNIFQLGNDSVKQACDLINIVTCDALRAEQSLQRLLGQIHDKDTGILWLHVVGSLTLRLQSELASTRATIQRQSWTCERVNM